MFSGVSAIVDDRPGSSFRMIHVLATLVFGSTHKTPPPTFSTLAGPMRKRKQTSVDGEDDGTYQSHILCISS